MIRVNFFEQAEWMTILTFHSNCPGFFCQMPWDDLTQSIKIEQKHLDVI